MKNRITMEGNWLYRPNYCTHGPQNWSWWHLFSWNIIDMSWSQKERPGFRVWIYTRWWAYVVDFYFYRQVKS